MGCCQSEPVVISEMSELPTENTPTTPQRERKPQDLLFLILFVLAMGGMASLCYYSVTNGNPHRYLYGSDSWGNVCGRKENSIIDGVSQSGMDHSERQFEFHFGLANVETALNPFSYLQSNEKPGVICVKECPTEKIKCKDYLIQNGYDIGSIPESVLNNHICTMMYQTILSHNTLLNRCVPSQLIQIGSNFVAVRSESSETNNTITNKLDEVLGESFAASVAKHVITSLLKYHRDIIYLTMSANLFCLLVVVLLQIFTKAAVLICLVIGGLGSTLFTFYLWYNYGLVKGYVTEEQFNKSVQVIAPAGTSLLNFIDERTNVSSVANNSNLNLDIVSVDRAFELLAFGDIKQSEYLLPWAILSTIFTIILIVILINLAKSIFLVVKIFEEACVAITKMPRLLLEPIKAMLVYFNVFSYFFLIGGYILTIQKPVVDHRNFVVYTRGNSSVVPILFLTHVFGCLWIMAFISGCLQMVLAGAVSKWFFDRGEKQEAKKEEPKPGLHVGCKTSSPTARATVDLLLYNLGTVAFGSLIIALVQTARIVLEYMQRQLHGRESKTAKNLLKALRCCLMCFEKILKFISKNAYICSAIYGYGFFHSAKRAFTLIVNNAQHAMALSCVGSVCNFLGKIAVVSLTALASIVYFVYFRIGRDAMLSEYFVPVITVCLGAFVVAHCYFTVYEVAIDTIFLCFCDDQERNNGDDRPYYSSVALQKYMIESSKEKSSGKRRVKSAPRESARCSISIPSVALPDPKKVLDLEKFARTTRTSRLSRRERNNICANKFWIESESSSSNPSRPVPMVYRPFSWDVERLDNVNFNENRKTIFTIENKLAEKGFCGKNLFLKTSCYQQLNNSDVRENRTPTPFPTSKNDSKKQTLPEISIPGQTIRIPSEEDMNYDLLSILSISSNEKRTQTESTKDSVITKTLSCASISSSDATSSYRSKAKNKFSDTDDSISQRNQGLL